MGDTLVFLSLMVPGTFLLGVNDVLIRRVLRGGRIGEQLFVAFEYIATGLLLAIPLAVVGMPDLKPGFWGAAFLTAGLNVFGQWAWYAAFKREEASLISPLRLVTPPLVIFSGYLVLREAPTAGGIFGILVTVAGLWLLMRAEAGNRSPFSTVVRRPGVLLGLAGAFSFAVSLPFDKRAVVGSSALFTVVVVFLALGFASLVIALLRGERAFDIRGNWRTMLVMPFVHAGASFLTYSALNYALAAYAASVKRLWSLWAVLLSGKFLEERNIGRKLLATAAMLAGIAVTVAFG